MKLKCGQIKYWINKTKTKLVRGKLRGICGYKIAKTTRTLYWVNSTHDYLVVLQASPKLKDWYNRLLFSKSSTLRVFWIYILKAPCLLLPSYLVDKIEHSRTKVTNDYLFLLVQQRCTEEECPWNYYGSRCAARRLWNRLTVGNILLQISAFSIFSSLNVLL